MSLAREDEFTMAHGGNTVRLRPSLRAAMRLERLHDGFPALFAKVDTFDTATIRAVILQAATDRTAAESFLEAMALLPVTTFISSASAPVASLCAALLPGDDEEAAPSKPGPEKPMTWQAALVELYRIGTGWFSWTPAETWNATPAEIVEAFKGRIALLKAQNGTAEGEQPAADHPMTAEEFDQIVEQGFDPAFDRAGLQALKDKLAAERPINA